MQPLAPGDPRQIGGHRLVGRLGVGGMGRVFLGISPGGRPVAVKVARPEIADDPVFRARFRTEVSLASRVQAFCTAPVVGADPDAEIPWLATVYIPGPSLQYAVRQFGPLPPPTVRTLVAGLAEALTAVHADGIVHRDLKPSNVLLATDGPRLIDFGISRALEGTALTRTGLLIGSPGFMAPEQVQGARAGPPADVFALGGTVIYAATGRGPFGDGPSHAVLFRAVSEQPDLSGLSPDLQRLAARCLDKDPQARPSAREVLAYLNGLAAEPSAPGWLPEAVATVAEEQATAVRTLREQQPPNQPPPNQPAASHLPRSQPAPSRPAPSQQQPSQRPPQPAPSQPPSSNQPPAAGTRITDPRARQAPVAPYAPNRQAVQEPPRWTPAASAGNPYAVRQASHPRNGAGTASLVLGVLGILFFFGPGLLLGSLGILLAVRGIRRAGRGQATNRNVAVMGLLASMAALLISLSWLGAQAERQPPAGSSAPPVTATFWPAQVKILAIA